MVVDLFETVWGALMVQRRSTTEPNGQPAPVDPGIDPHMPGVPGEKLTDHCVYVLHMASV